MNKNELHLNSLPEVDRRAIEALVKADKLIAAMKYYRFAAGPTRAGRKVLSDTPSIKEAREYVLDVRDSLNAGGRLVPEPVDQVAIEALVKADKLNAAMKYYRLLHRPGRDTPSIKEARDYVLDVRDSLEA